MDLIILVIGLAIIGFILWLIETKVPMDPIIKYIIYAVVFVVMVLYLIKRFGNQVPNVMN